MSAASPPASSTTPATTPAPDAGLLGGAPPTADAAPPKADAAPPPEKTDAAPPAKTEDTKPDSGVKWYDAEKVELKIPDALKAAGFDSLDPETVKDFVPLAKALDLKPEQADQFVALAGGLVTRLMASQQAAMNERATKWADEVRADKEFGGDKLTATVVAARDVVVKYGGEDFLKELAEMKYQNSPLLVRFLARVARATADDNFDVRRGDGAASEADDETARAQRLYPGLNKSLGKE